jgi:hypothetical protein
MLMVMKMGSVGTNFSTTMMMTWFAIMPLGSWIGSSDTVIDYGRKWINYKHE